MLTDKAATIFSEVQMLKRYETLSLWHQHPEKLEDLDRLKVLKLLQERADGFKFFRKETFYGLHEFGEGMSFKFNLGLENGIVEPIIWGKFSDEQVGGALASVTRRIKAYEGNTDLSMIPYPRYNDYEELQSILDELFSMYADFKVACIKHMM